MLKLRHYARDRPGTRLGTMFQEVGNARAVPEVRECHRQCGALEYAENSVSACQASGSLRFVSSLHLY